MRTATAVLREMRWWDIDAVLELEHELFPEDAWSAGMFWSELAHSAARGPPAAMSSPRTRPTGGSLATPVSRPSVSWPTSRRSE